MTHFSPRFLGLIVSLTLAGSLHLGGSVVTSTEAEAAQVYVCICNGERKRLFASSRYCEKQNKVKQCTRAQYQSVYSRACKQRGCRLP